MLTNQFKSILTNILFLSVVMISSCKKDDPSSPGGTPTSNPALANIHYQYQLNFDGQPYSAEDGIGGYSNYSFVYNFDSSGFTKWLHFSQFVRNNTTPSLAISKATLKPNGILYNINDVRNAFLPGSHIISQDPYTLFIHFQLNDTVSYSSGQGSDQTNSTFIITDTLTETDILGPYFKFKATFNCKVYDMSGNQHEITNGTVVCKFQPLI